MQVTLDAFLGKAEIISRKGFAEVGSDKQTNLAWVIGGEYTIYSIAESDADLTLYAELSHDERGAKSTSPLQDDLVLAARYAFNDVEDTDLRAAIIEDLDYDTRTLTLEFNRRLSDTLSLNMEAYAFLESDPLDVVTNQLRKDSYFGANLRYSF